MNRRLTIAAFASVVLAPTKLFAILIPRVAITIEQDESIGAPTVARFTTRLTGGLLKQNHYQIVERARLAPVIREQGLSNSAYADPKTAAALGRIVGASRILHIAVTAEATNSAGAYLQTHVVNVWASFTLIGVDTGRIIAAGTASGNAQKQLSSAAGSYSEAVLFREAADACADDLVGQIDTPVGR